MNGDAMSGGGPEGAASNTEFLQLELSKMLFSEAQSMARQVVLELMRESMREHLRERFGEQLAALGRLAAEDMVADMEANLTIEAAIGKRQEHSQDLSKRIAEALAKKG